ncbi:hypothetical protein [Tunturiibacter gelidiferens]|uniref:hypothetical protein n=1 Tax=Tunturiibacter gelidiferens TaxID=3069689 RepID=UPI003D9BB1AE
MQALTGCISVVLSILTTIVLVIAYRTARAQTEAAKTQAAAALKQVESSEKQMAILEQQLAAARRQIDESVRPMIFIPAAAASLPELTQIDIENLGSGPAMEVTSAYARFGDPEIEEHFVVPGTIVKGGAFPFTIDPDRVRKFGLIFLYQSLSGTTCVSEVTEVRPHFRYYPDAGAWVRTARTRRG